MPLLGDTGMSVHLTRALSWVKIPNGLARFTPMLQLAMVVGIISRPCKYRPAQRPVVTIVRRSDV